MLNKLPEVTILQAKKPNFRQAAHFLATAMG
jgi:hypothetical protein